MYNFYSRYPGAEVTFIICPDGFFKLFGKFWKVKYSDSILVPDRPG